MELENIPLLPEQEKILGESGLLQLKTLNTLVKSELNAHESKIKDYFDEHKTYLEIKLKENSDKVYSDMTEIMTDQVIPEFDRTHKRIDIIENCIKNQKKLNDTLEENAGAINYVINAIPKIQSSVRYLWTTAAGLILGFILFEIIKHK